MRGIGTVKFYNPKKGYGFITSGSQDIFFHITDYDPDSEYEPEKGIEVEFTLSKSIDRKSNIERLRARDIKEKMEEGNSL